MLIIVETYFLLNTLFIKFMGLDEKSVPVPLEPILFGILYGSYYLLYTLAEKFVSGKILHGLSGKMNAKEGA